MTPYETDVSHVWTHLQQYFWIAAFIVLLSFKRSQCHTSMDLNYLRWRIWEHNKLAWIHFPSHHVGQWKLSTVALKKSLEWQKRPYMDRNIGKEQILIAMTNLSGLLSRPSHTWWACSHVQKRDCTGSMDTCGRIVWINEVLQAFTQESLAGRKTAHFIDKCFRSRHRVDCNAATRVLPYAERMRFVVYRFAQWRYFSPWTCCWTWIQLAWKQQLFLSLFAVAYHRWCHENDIHHHIWSSLAVDGVVRFDFADMIHGYIHSRQLIHPCIPSTSSQIQFISMHLSILRCTKTKPMPDGYDCRASASFTGGLCCESS